MRGLSKNRALPSHTPDRPLTDFGQLWTDRRQRHRAQWRGASGIPGKQAVGYRPASTSTSKMA